MFQNWSILMKIIKYYCFIDYFSSFDKLFFRKKILLIRIEKIYFWTFGNLRDTLSIFLKKEALSNLCFRTNFNYVKNYCDKCLPESNFIFTLSSSYKDLWASQGRVKRIHTFTKIYIRDLCSVTQKYKYFRTAFLLEISEHSLVTLFLKFRVNHFFLHFEKMSIFHTLVLTLAVIVDSISKLRIIYNTIYLYPLHYSKFAGTYLYRYIIILGRIFNTQLF